MQSYIRAVDGTCSKFFEIKVHCRLQNESAENYVNIKLMKSLYSPESS